VSRKDHQDEYDWHLSQRLTPPKLTEHKINLIDNLKPVEQLPISSNLNPKISNSIVLPIVGTPPPAAETKSIVKDPPKLSLDNKDKDVEPVSGKVQEVPVTEKDSHRSVLPKKYQAPVPVKHKTMDNSMASKSHEETISEEIIPISTESVTDNFWHSFGDNSSNMKPENTGTGISAANDDWGAFFTDVQKPKDETNIVADSTFIRSETQNEKLIDAFGVSNETEIKENPQLSADLNLSVHDILLQSAHSREDIFTISSTENVIKEVASGNPFDDTSSIDSSDANTLISTPFQSHVTLGSGNSMKNSSFDSFSAGAEKAMDGTNPFDETSSIDSLENDKRNVLHPEISTGTSIEGLQIEDTVSAKIPSKKYRAPIPNISTGHEPLATTSVENLNTIPILSSDESFSFTPKITTEGNTFSTFNHHEIDTNESQNEYPDIFGDEDAVPQSKASSISATPVLDWDNFSMFDVSGGNDNEIQPTDPNQQTNWMDLDAFRFVDKNEKTQNVGMRPFSHLDSVEEEVEEEEQEDIQAPKFKIEIKQTANFFDIFEFNQGGEKNEKDETSIVQDINQGTEDVFSISDKKENSFTDDKFLDSDIQSTNIWENSENLSQCLVDEDKSLDTDEAQTLRQESNLITDSHPFLDFNSDDNLTPVTKDNNEFKSSGQNSIVLDMNNDDDWLLNSFKSESQPQSESQPESNFLDLSPASNQSGNNSFEPNADIDENKLSLNNSFVGFTDEDFFHAKPTKQSKDLEEQDEVETFSLDHGIDLQCKSADNLVGTDTAKLDQPQDIGSHTEQEESLRESKFKVTEAESIDSLGVFDVRSSEARSYNNVQMPNSEEINQEFNNETIPATMSSSNEAPSSNGCLETMISQPEPVYGNELQNLDYIFPADVDTDPVASSSISQTVNYTTDTQTNPNTPAEWSVPEPHNGANGIHVDRFSESLNGSREDIFKESISNGNLQISNGNLHATNVNHNQVNAINGSKTADSNIIQAANFDDGWHLDVLDIHARVIFSYNMRTQQRFCFFQGWPTHRFFLFLDILLNSFLFMRLLYFSVIYCETIQCKIIPQSFHIIRSICIYKLTSHYFGLPNINSKTFSFNSLT